MASQTSGRDPQLELGPPSAQEQLTKPSFPGSPSSHSLLQSGVHEPGATRTGKRAESGGGARLSPLYRASQLWLYAHRLLSTSLSGSRVLVAQRGCPDLKESRNLDGWLVLGLPRPLSPGSARKRNPEASVLVPLSLPRNWPCAIGSVAPTVSSFVARL